MWLRLWYDRRAHSVLPWSQIAHPKSPIANLSAICPQPIHIRSLPTGQIPSDLTRLDVRSPGPRRRVWCRTGARKERGKLKNLGKLKERGKLSEGLQKRLRIRFRALPWSGAGPLDPWLRPAVC